MIKHINNNNFIKELYDQHNITNYLISFSKYQTFITLNIFPELHLA